MWRGKSAWPTGNGQRDGGMGLRGGVMGCWPPGDIVAGRRAKRGVHVALRGECAVCVCELVNLLV